MAAAKRAVLLVGLVVLLPLILVIVLAVTGVFGREEHWQRGAGRAGHPAWPEGQA